MASKTAGVAERNGGAIETRAFVWPKMTIAVFSVLGRTPEELLLRLAAFKITSHWGLRSDPSKFQLRGHGLGNSETRDRRFIMSGNVAWSETTSLGADAKNSGEVRGTLGSCIEADGCPNQSGRSVLSGESAEEELSGPRIGC